MKNKKEKFMLGEIFQKISSKIGATVTLEPQWGVVGQITFKSGKHSYFRYNTLDLNPMGSSEIAKDKDFANFFMDSMGYPIVPGSKTFFVKSFAESINAKDRGINDAYKYAVSIGFPVIVKPNSGSQGSGVSLVHNKREFYRAMKNIFKKDRVAIVQKPVKGKDYRVVVLDDHIISAYQRIPLNVTGDGKSNIKDLLTKKQNDFIEAGRDTKIKYKDPRIAIKLNHLGLNIHSIPKKDEVVFLLDNANLSTGGDSVDVTSSIHQEFKDIAIKLTKDMGLRLCGVDFMVEDDISNKPGNYWVLEINSAPGLDHYAKMGEAQEKIVEDLYLKVLQHIEK